MSGPTVAPDTSERHHLELVRPEFAPDQIQSQYADRFDGVPGVREMRILWNGGARRLFPETAAEAVEIAAEAHRLQRHAYFGVATRQDTSLESGKGGRLNLSHVRGPWVDADPKSPEELASFRSKLATFPHRPSLTVWTGHGVHVYWAFSEPYRLDSDTPHNLEWFESLLRGLANYFDSDRNVTDASRILRVAGTINWKREGGLVPTPCFIEKAAAR